MLPRLECNGAKILAHCNLLLAGTTGACHHAQLIFVLLVEMGFLHVGQAGHELLTSGDPPALASQSAGITGMSHHTWPSNSFSNMFAFFIFIFETGSHSVTEAGVP